MRLVLGTIATIVGVFATQVSSSTTRKLTLTLQRIVDGVVAAVARDPALLLVMASLLTTHVTSENSPDGLCLSRPAQRTVLLAHQHTSGDLWTRTPSELV